MNSKNNPNRLEVFRFFYYHKTYSFNLNVYFLISFFFIFFLTFNPYVKAAIKNQMQQRSSMYPAINKEIKKRENKQALKTLNMKESQIKIEGKKVESDLNPLMRKGILESKSNQEVKTPVSPNLFPIKRKKSSFFSQRVQEINILNTEQGFRPSVVRVFKNSKYKINVVNVNKKNKNASFILSQYSIFRATYFGDIISFTLQPMHEGIYSFQCPETGQEGWMLVLPEKIKFIRSLSQEDSLSQRFMENLKPKNLESHSLENHSFSKKDFLTSSIADSSKKIKKNKKHLNNKTHIERLQIHKSLDQQKAIKAEAKKKEPLSFEIKPLKKELNFIQRELKKEKKTSSSKNSLGESAFLSKEKKNLKYTSHEHLSKIPILLFQLEERSLFLIHLTLT